MHGLQFLPVPQLSTWSKTLVLKCDLTSSITWTVNWLEMQSLSLHPTLTARNPVEEEPPIHVVSTLQVTVMHTPV